MKRFATLRTLFALAIVAALAGAAASAQPRDVSLHGRTCMVADVPGMLVLPDGKSQVVSSVKICFERWLSPVSAIHVLYLDGRTWGMLFGRAGKDPEAQSPVPLIVYARRGQEVRLLGFAWPEPHCMLTMAFGVLGGEADPSGLLAKHKDPEDSAVVPAGVD